MQCEDNVLRFPDFLKTAMLVSMKKTIECIVTGDGRYMLLTNTGIKHIRLLNDKVWFEITSGQRVNSTVGKKEFCWLLTCLGGFYLGCSFLKRFETYKLALMELSTTWARIESQQMAEDAKDKTIDHVLASFDAPPRNKKLSVTRSGSLSEGNNRSVGQIYYCSYWTSFCQLRKLSIIKLRSKRINSELHARKRWWPFECSDIIYVINSYIICIDSHNFLTAGT
jgi:hypothetical protein